MSLDVSFQKYVSVNENVDMTSRSTSVLRSRKLGDRQRHRRRARIQLPQETLTRRRASRTTVSFCFGVVSRHRFFFHW